MDVTQFVDAVSASEPDWSRERIRRFWDPGRKLLRAIRKYQACRHRDTALARLASKYWVINHWFWSLITQSEIHLNCRIEGGLVLPHPTGIIIHPRSRIGPNCLIFQQVTLAGAVELGGHCDLGAGAKIIGPVRLGRHVQVGANAVVTMDMPDGSIVVGIPARAVTQRPAGSETQREQGGRPQLDTAEGCAPPPAVDRDDGLRSGRAVAEDAVGPPKAARRSPSSAVG